MEWDENTAWTEASVYAAFQKLSATGNPFMQKDIAQYAGVSEGTVSKIVNGASWWTPEHRAMAQIERQRLSRLAHSAWYAKQREMRPRTKRHYSDETAQRVEAAFLEIEAAGAVPTNPDIVRLTRISEYTVRCVLRDAPYWTRKHREAAIAEGVRRGQEWSRNPNHAGPRGAQRWTPDQRQLFGRRGGIETWKRGTGYQMTAEERETAGRKGWVIKYVTGSHQGALAPSQGRGLLGQLTDLQVLAEIERCLKEDAPLPSAGAIARALGKSPRGVRASLRRLRTKGLLESPPEAFCAQGSRSERKARTKAYQGIVLAVLGECGPLPHREITQRTGISYHAVGRVLYRLRAEGLIDEHNRPIEPTRTEEGDDQ